jgi:DNA-binding NarL/FixJ family response regulator
MRIVIVDDNRSMRKVLAALFESHGHQVLADLGDGAGLLECVKQNKPDLLCLDYNLPGLNGLELLKAVGTAAPDVDVVIVTGSNDAALESQAANAGAAGFLRKPFSQNQILEELKQVEEARKLYLKASFKPAIPDVCLSDPLKNTAVIVDDSGTVRTLLRELLETIGISVVGTANNGEEGVAVVRKHRPALVCLDVEMPVMSGLEALPLIREASPQSKVVMVTGNPDKGFVEKAIAGGAKGYILKPLRPNHVEAFMKKLLAQ